MFLSLLSIFPFKQFVSCVDPLRGQMWLECRGCGVERKSLGKTRRERSFPPLPRHQFSWELMCVSGEASGSECCWGPTSNFLGRAAAWVSHTLWEGVSGDSYRCCQHWPGSEDKSSQVQMDYLDKNVDLSAGTSSDWLWTVSQLPSVPSWGSEDSESEKELNYRRSCISGGKSSVSPRRTAIK